MLTSKCLIVGLAGSVEDGLREVARAEMTKLRDVTGETVHLAIPEVPELVIVARVDGTNSLRTFLPLGTKAPLHATASGRALLAAMPDAAVAEVLDSGLEQFTSSTLHDRDDVLREIERTRRRGYALNAAEWRPDIAAVGVAIGSRQRTPVAALSISMPLNRYQETDLATVGELLVSACRRIAEQIHDRPQSDPGFE